MMSFVKCLPIASLSLIAACASTPAIHYYTLDMTPSDRVVPAVKLQVERFRTSDALGRPQMAIHTSPTQIEYYAIDQWVGDLGELVGRKLAAELGSATPDAPTLRVSGTVVDCGQVDRAQNGAAARLTLAVELRAMAQRFSDQPLLARTYHCERPAQQSSPGAVARALSRCLEDIAVELAGDAAGLAAD